MKAAISIAARRCACLEAYLFAGYPPVCFPYIESYHLGWDVIITNYILSVFENFQFYDYMCRFYPMSRWFYITVLWELSFYSVSLNNGNIKNNFDMYFGYFFGKSIYSLIVFLAVQLRLVIHCFSTTCQFMFTYGWCLKKNWFQFFIFLKKLLSGFF